MLLLWLPLLFMELFYNHVCGWLHVVVGSHCYLAVASVVVGASRCCQTSVDQWSSIVRCCRSPGRQFVVVVVVGATVSCCSCRWRFCCYRFECLVAIREHSRFACLNATAILLSYLCKELRPYSYSTAIQSFTNDPPTVCVNRKINPLSLLTNGVFFVI